MNKRHVVILVLILILILVGYFLWKALTVPQRPLHATQVNTILAKEVLVTLGINGFSPTKVIVKPGTAVRWKNTTNKAQTVNSDNYPTNQLHKELNFGVFNASSSVQYIFTKIGTYGYHNQFSPEQKGTVVVEN